jgi:hypothetical protein
MSGVKLLVRGLGHRRLPVALAAVAVAVALPSLGAGWQLDDLFHRETLLGETPLVSPWEAFSTLRGDPAVLRAFVDLGLLPWWSAEDLRLAFFRFLSVATHRLDYALWPESPALMHAQNLVWYGLAVAAVTVLYRRVLGPTWVAGLAALAFALDDAHVLPAAWIANRNAWVAMVFGIVCVVAHDRWRRDGWRPGAWLGPLALALALAAGELGLSTIAYLTAYVTFLDRVPWRQRLAGFVPYAGVAAVWAALYRCLGFGVSSSGWYIDPVASPGRFAAALVYRAPFLLLGQWTGVPAEAGGLLAPRFPAGMWFHAVGFVAVLGLLLLPVVRRDAVARFLASGMCLSLIPIAGAVPQNRELLFVGVGGMGLVAQLVEGAFGAPPWRPGSRAWRWAARGFAVLSLPVHLLLAPLVGPLQLATWKELTAPTEAAVGSLPNDPALAAQDLVVVDAPDFLYFVSPIEPIRRLRGLPVPRHVRVLANGLSPIAVTRRDASTLDVDLERGLFRSAFARLYRDADHRFTPGQVIALTGVTITIVETAQDGTPTRIRYRFDRPLEDPTLRWVRWEEPAYVPFTLPTVGETVHLESAIGPFERMGGWSIEAPR